MLEKNSGKNALLALLTPFLGPYFWGPPPPRDGPHRFAILFVFSLSLQTSHEDRRTIRRGWRSCRHGKIVGDFPTMGFGMR